MREPRCIECGEPWPCAATIEGRKDRVPHRMDAVRDGPAVPSWTVDPETGAIYVRLSHSAHARTVEYTDDLIADYASDGSLIGIEILALVDEHGTLCHGEAPGGAEWMVCGRDGCEFTVERGEGREFALHASDDHAPAAGRILPSVAPAGARAAIGALERRKG